MLSPKYASTSPYFTHLLIRRTEQAIKGALVHQSALTSVQCAEGGYFMAKSRGITTFILTIGFTTLIITACETQQERERAGEATPSPTARVATSPTAGLTPGASPATSPVAALTPFDKEFVNNAARGSLMEVQLGNVAAQRATSEDVKRFGQRMATDHSQLGQTLRQLASNLNITLPQDLTTEQQNLVKRIENLTGKAFDRDYMKEMVAAHTKDVSEFERAAAQATNADIKQFASQSVSMLRDHLKQAREVAAKLGVKVEGHI